MKAFEGIVRKNWGRTLALISLASACSGTVEQRYENGAPSVDGGSAASGVGGASGDAGSGSVGGTNFGGRRAGGTGGGGTGGGGAGDGGAGGFATGGVSGNLGRGGGGNGSGGVGGAGGDRPDSCFAAGTPIATPSGPRPIEELRPGDLVFAYDDQAARVVPRPVTATFVHLDQPVGALPLGDGRVLRLTGNHPIYLPDQQRYADARELRGDERLLTLSGSAHISSLISGAFLASGTELVTVYNISVAGEHNYFAGGVLVHNKSDAGCLPIPFSGACSPTPGCLDPLRPTNERVAHNQVVGSSDAGPPDVWIDGGMNRATSAAICSEGSAPHSPAYMAFDVVNESGQTPRVAISGSRSGAQCTGFQIGELGFQPWPPPPYVKTTQCTPIDERFSSLTLVGLNVGTQVSNLRFVAGCDCPRSLASRTDCLPVVPASGHCLTSGDW